uniref:AlNc14C256G9726 protein n=1 Tax=Albugo laibachii Nc14 TaxID=890382 RepID=F0WTQ2_9STRA|nr:AlNc14C256G9726 [Albugo laibachii Nc14]|eukprot:CCA24744.1 AlNc14C256G9726 [Albugo laibachii Nc14]
MDIFNISDTSESSKEDARKKKTMPRCVDDIADTLDFLEDENYSQTLFLSDVSSFDSILLENNPHSADDSASFRYGTLKVKHEGKELSAMFPGKKRRKQLEFNET